MARMIIGKAGNRSRLHCGCRVVRKMTSRGLRYMIAAPDTKMVRFISEQEAHEAQKAGEICAFIPEPFTSK